MSVLFANGPHRGELQKAVRQTRTEGEWQARQRRRGGKADKDDTASADRGVNKVHRLKRYYCEGPHIQANCPEKSKDAQKPITREKKG